MAAVKRPQDPFYQRFVLTAVAVAGCLLAASQVSAQALHVERVGRSTEFLLVSQPLSEATTVAWPIPDGSVASFTSGGMTLGADLEASLAELEGAPPVVVAVGGAQAGDLRPVLELGLAQDQLQTSLAQQLPRVEGGVDRRLGAPGSEALLRLEVLLPPVADWRRSTVEVLWELLPELLSTDLPGLTSRVDGDLGRLEARVNPELVEFELRKLRLTLAQVSEDVRLDEARVESFRQRLQVRRQAQLGIHPEGAQKLTELWLAGGVAAVREYLFGIEGVTLEAIRNSARQWLPLHPGHAVLMLPPRVFNPRFAPGPEQLQLANDVVAAVLERPGAGLSAVCLQPVVVPDVDGSLTSTVLSRLAAELRASEGAPGWVRVHEQPPLLELAAPADGFAELLEVLQRALPRIAADDRQVDGLEDDARSRALKLMAGVLGLAESVGLSPAELLQPSNLAIGVVAPDGEAAVEALQKFPIGGARARGTADSSALSAVPRTREAAPGQESVLVLSIELFPSGDEVAALMAGGLIEHRARLFLGDVGVELLEPLVPGRTVLLLVLRAGATLDELEQLVSEMWAEITAPVSEEELAELRRPLAAQVASRYSGPLGYARRCAAVAAGSRWWRLPSEMELEVLTATSEWLNEALAGLAAWELVQTTGAGLLPIPEHEAESQLEP
jgi:hypothetical protein